MIFANELLLLITGNIVFRKEPIVNGITLRITSYEVKEYRVIRKDRYEVVVISIDTGKIKYIPIDKLVNEYSIKE